MGPGFRCAGLSGVRSWAGAPGLACQVPRLLPVCCARYLIPAGWA
jgi:hypothetical protein